MKSGQRNVKAMTRVITQNGNNSINSDMEQKMTINGVRVNNLKEWIDDYESTRFTAVDEQTAVITSEYNMECVREWLEHHATFEVIAEY